MSVTSEWCFNFRFRIAFLVFLLSVGVYVHGPAYVAAYVTGAFALVVVVRAAVRGLWAAGA